MRVSALMLLVISALGAAPGLSRASQSDDAGPLVPESLVRVADLRAAPPSIPAQTWTAGLALVPRLANPAPLTPSRTERVPAPPARRPAALLPLYGAFGALQVVDLVTTRRALDGGTAREGNPVMAPFAGNLRASIALKAASTTATILLTEHLWKKDRAAAVGLMAALGSAYAVIAVHNLRTGQY